MRPFQSITTRRWGGLNEDENPLTLSPGELTEAKNVALHGGALGTRPGLERESASGDYDAALTGTVPVQGAFDWSTNNDFERDKLLVVGGTNLFTAHGTTVTKDGGVQITSGANNVWQFAAWQDKVFFVGGKGGDASADTFNYWDGTNNVFAITGIDNISGTQIAQPQHILQRWGYLFIAGMNPASANLDASNNPAVVRYHQIGQDPTLGTSWPAGNTIGAGQAPGSIGGLNDYGDEFVTGLAGFKDNQGDWLLVGTSRQIHAFARVPDGTFIKGDAIANGVVHQRAFVSLGLDAGDAIYMSPLGIHSLRQSQEFGGKETKFLSWKIRRTFERINRARIHLSTGAYWQDEGMVLFAISTGANTAHDTILCLDIKNQSEITAETARWYIWHLQGAVGGTLSPNVLFVSRDEDDQPRLYVGTTVGDVCRFTRDVYDDLGNGYHVQWTTADQTLGDISVEKIVGDTHVVIQPGGDYMPTVQIIRDFGQRSSGVIPITMGTAGAAVWGSFTWGGASWAGSSTDTVFRRKFYGRGRGVAVSHRFAHGGTNEPFFIPEVTQQVAPLSEALGDVD